jgi:nicotinamide mononucleotide adenylyltransferase
LCEGLGRRELDSVWGGGEIGRPSEPIPIPTSLEGSEVSTLLAPVTTLGLVCRFQPLHCIHAALLAALADRADLLRVGIGSPARVDARNPFSLEERLTMLAAVCDELPVDLEFIPVPDLGHGPRWAAQAVRLFGDLDRFVSANGYVRRLLEPAYRLAHPLEVIPPSARAPIGGAEVRLAMAQGAPWEHLVPPRVAEILQGWGLVDRFRREHGLAVLRDYARPALGALREESDRVRMG